MLPACRLFSLFSSNLLAWELLRSHSIVGLWHGLKNRTCRMSEHLIAKFRNRTRISDVSIQCSDAGFKYKVNGALHEFFLVTLVEWAVTFEAFLPIRESIPWIIHQSNWVDLLKKLFTMNTMSSLKLTNKAVCWTNETKEIFDFSRTKPDFIVLLFSTISISSSADLERSLVDFETSQSSEVKTLPSWN